MAKMSTKGIAWIIIGAVVFIIAILYFMAYLFRSPYKYDWSESYDPKSNQPYGLMLVQDMLKEYHPKEAFKVMDDRVIKELKPDENKPSNYVFIGANQYYDSVTVSHLLEYLRMGNTAFIASSYVPYQLLDNLHEDEAYYLDDYSYTYSYAGLYDTTISVNFEHPSLRLKEPLDFTFFSYGEKYGYYWDYVGEDVVADSLTSYALLGSIQDTAYNYIKIHVGKGALLIHTNPLLFTNFFMASENGYKYFNGVFSHLNNGPIYWDEASKLPDFTWGQNQSFKEGPFRYILSQPALKYALYLVLALVILYVLFRAKREQKVIPVIARPENTSLDFLKTVSILYFMQHNHQKLAHDQWELFLSHIRERYNLPTRKFDEAFFQRLVQRSQISREQLNRIFEKYKFIADQDKISEDLLSEFYQLLQHYYTNSK